MRRRRGAAPPLAPEVPPERDTSGMEPADRAIAERALPYTITSVARVQAVIDAVRYCVAREVPGAFAECGVWLGGSVIAMLLALLDAGVDDRDVYLYDTFEGMTEPGEHDTSPVDRPALEVWREAKDRGERPWGEFFDGAVFDEGTVRRNVLATGYPEERLHFVAGRVEDTLPGTAPERIALLRLDTDWYESTRHELETLYPRLAGGGVLIVDDYGHWEGARRAVDDYLGERPLLLHRIDYTARIAVKQ